MSINIQISAESAEGLLHDLKLIAKRLIGDSNLRGPSREVCEARTIVVDGVVTKSVDAIIEAQPPTEPAPAAEETTARRRGRKPKTEPLQQPTVAPSTPDVAHDPATMSSDAPAISTGEERVGPEDSPEVQAQDAADEAAESAATKTELTHDDLRSALGAYMKAFGMPAAQEDGPKVFKLVFPENSPAKISDIPADQATLAKVLAGIQEMTTKNPFGRKVVAA